MTWTETKAGGFVGHVKVSVTEGNDKTYLNIRKYFKDQSGELRPTKQGVMIPKEQWPDFAAILANLID